MSLKKFTGGDVGNISVAKTNGSPPVRFCLNTWYFVRFNPELGLPIPESNARSVHWTSIFVGVSNVADVPTTWNGILFVKTVASLDGGEGKVPFNAVTVYVYVVPKSTVSSTKKYCTWIIETVIFHSNILSLLVADTE